MKKVLVVDDSQSVRETLVLVLRSAGFDASGAATAATAVEIANVQRPDILLCDIHLGGRTGVQVSQQIQTLLPDCRVLLMSGDSSSAEILADACARGYKFEVLPKPTLPEELFAVLRKSPVRFLRKP